MAFVLTLLDVAGAGTLLAAWLAAKLAASWRRFEAKDPEDAKGRDIRVGTMIALIAGVVSVGFGAAMGAIVRYFIMAPNTVG